MTLLRKFRLSTIAGAALIAIALMIIHTSCTPQKKSAAAATERTDAPPAPKDILPAQCGGRWYPGGAAELGAAVDGYLDAAKDVEHEGRIVALISPHAGYRYSGPTAGYAYRQVRGKKYDTVVVVGFAHGFRMNGAAVYTGDAVDTPLGYLRVDTATAKALVKTGGVFHDDERAFFHAEHSLENQLPFIKRALGDPQIVLVMIGEQTPETVDGVGDGLAAALKGKDALLVASTDMSHFWPHAEAGKLDAELIGLVEELDGEAIRGALEKEGDTTGRRMCGHGAALAVLRAARALGADGAVKLHYETSGDVTGEKGEVVGYLAAAVVNTAVAEKSDGEGAMKNGGGTDGELNEEQQRKLLKIARESLEAFIGSGERKKFAADEPALTVKHGMFVTLEKHGRLRGCMGHFDEDTPIAALAGSQTLVSATRDPRFPPVQANELKDITIEISVLSTPRAVASYEEIEVGRHGVILKKGFRGATFLPQVAPEQGWDRDEMLTNLAMKAGLGPDDWREGASFEVYTAQVFGEEEPGRK